MKRMNGTVFLAVLIGVVIFSAMQTLWGQKPRGDSDKIIRIIPAPRGRITDRNGEILAQSRVSYYFALQFSHAEKEQPDQLILDWAEKRLKQASELTGKKFNVSSKQLLNHYKIRKKVPMLLPLVVEVAKKELWEDQLMSGLAFQPICLRDYPADSAAAHVVGYVRSQGKLPKGPIEPHEPVWEQTTGATGLENTLNDELAGKAGVQTLFYGEDGSLVDDEVTRQPVEGNTIVTTLDLEWQQHAEAVLRDSCKRGAFVVLDIETGEILVLASLPAFNLNVWVPRISEEDYAVIKNDERSPEYARAFKATYPPAGTFMPIVALAGLSTGAFEADTLFDCPPYVMIGGRKFRNVRGKDEGEIDVKRALAISSGVWSYQARFQMDPTTMFTFGKRMGFGSRTGVPLYSESSGILPTSDYIVEKEGRPMSKGDTANIAIGQGYLSATPLQVAQATAALADRESLSQLRLVRRIEDHEGQILEATKPSVRNALEADPDSVKVVHEGMWEMVNGPEGRARNGRLEFCEVAGSTGTAQWKGAGPKKQELAWFTGFLPYHNPRYAFVILYEGDPGQSLSGNSFAAPMTRLFFNKFSEEILKTISAEKEVRR